MRDHLVDLHGSGCWECGETIGPGWTIWSGWEPRDVESLYLRDHGPPEPGPIVLHVDHIRPLWSLTDEERRELRWWLPFNLQLLCAACHAAKTAREARERAQVRRGERRAG